MKAFYFQHRNAVLMHVEYMHENGTVTLTREPGAKPFITCARTHTPRPGYAQLIEEPPAIPPTPPPPPLPSEVPESS